MGFTVSVCLTAALPVSAGATCLAAPVTLTAQSTPPAFAWPRAVPARAREVEVRLRMTLEGPPEGAGLVLLQPGAAVEGLSWVEPNVKGCFGVGFDTSNPPTENIFNADGNVYDRPQREVSLHWNGAEVANALSPVEFTNGQPHEVLVRIEFEVAAAEVSVSIDGAPTHDRVFVPGMLPYASRPAFGLSPLDKSRCTVELLGLTSRGKAPVTQLAEHRDAVVGAVLNSGHQQEEATVALPDPGKPYARVLLTVALAVPPDGIDPWDRAGSVYVWSEAGERFEILRFITPFGRAATWQVDVTGYQSLLRGSRKMAVAIGTWVKGWKVDVGVDYYAGKPAQCAHRVTNLWNGDFEYGNPAAPMAAQFPTRNVTLDPETRRVKVRAVVTGHGMSPNTDNAAEFMPAGRTVTANGHVFENLLWRTDCYLNPCRPQGGTWKFDRAGWCPGSLVRPWDIDLGEVAKPGEALRLDYKPQPYTNENAGQGRASHLVEVQLIEYR